MPYDPQNALEMRISEEIGYGTIIAVPQSVVHVVHTLNVWYKVWYTLSIIDEIRHGKINTVALKSTPDKNLKQRGNGDVITRPRPAFWVCF